MQFQQEGFVGQGPYSLVVVCCALESPSGMNVVIWGKANYESQGLCHCLLLVLIPSDKGERGI